MPDKPTPTDAAAPECLTCNDHGAVGNILTAEPCPDCTRWNVQPARATQQAGGGGGGGRVPVPPLLQGRPSSGRKPKGGQHGTESST